MLSPSRKVRQIQIGMSAFNQIHHQRIQLYPDRHHHHRAEPPSEYICSCFIGARVQVMSINPAAEVALVTQALIVGAVWGEYDLRRML